MIKFLIQLICCELHLISFPGESDDNRVDSINLIEMLVILFLTNKILGITLGNIDVDEGCFRLC